MRTLAREVTGLWLARREEQGYPMGLVQPLADPQPQAPPAHAPAEPGGNAAPAGFRLSPGAGAAAGVAAYNAQAEWLCCRQQPLEVNVCSLFHLLVCLQPRLCWRSGARSCRLTMWWRPWSSSSGCCIRGCCIPTCWHPGCCMLACLESAQVAKPRLLTCLHASVIVQGALPRAARPPAAGPRRRDSGGHPPAPGSHRAPAGGAAEQQRGERARPARQGELSAAAATAAALSAVLDASAPLPPWKRGLLLLLLPSLPPNLV